MTHADKIILAATRNLVERFFEITDPEGFAFWLGLLAKGHSEDTVRGWILDGFEK